MSMWVCPTCEAEIWSTFDPHKDEFVTTSKHDPNCAKILAGEMTLAEARRLAKKRRDALLKGKRPT